MKKKNEYQSERKISPQMRLGKGYGEKRKTGERTVVVPSGKNIFNRRHDPWYKAVLRDHSSLFYCSPRTRVSDLRRKIFQTSRKSKPRCVEV